MPNNTVFTVPPSDVPNIGNALSDTKIAWAWFGDQFNLYLADPYGLTYPAQQYCNICNWAQYNTAIMTNATERAYHLHDTSDLYTSIASGNLPPVSWVKPSGLVDGHPSSSKLNLFEGFVKKIVDEVQANSALWNDTAIFVTVDEGGGYYDFGLCAGARLLRRRHPHPDDRRLQIQHRRAYHPLVHRPRLDNEVHRGQLGLDPSHIAQPGQSAEPGRLEGNPYVPVNRPAIGDLMDMFTFP